MRTRFANNVANNGETVGDAPRDKCAHFREINGTAAAFQYLQKNYNPTASSFL
ncbi:glucosamine-6-phosphate deaminase [Salmonella enterica]|nr:glucosamine-6-phosphate deaminase [Salmonella enterica]